jgi:hypothetical protein
LNNIDKRAPDDVPPIKAGVACNQDIRGAGVSAIVQQNTKPFGCNFFCKRNELIETASTASDQRKPWPCVTHHLVVNFDFTNL